MLKLPNSESKIKILKLFEQKKYISLIEKKKQKNIFNI